MTIEALVAEALHETAGLNHNLGEGPMRAICQSVPSHGRRAESFLATPAGQKLARLAAIGEAVERLDDLSKRQFRVNVEATGDEWSVRVEWYDDSEPVGARWKHGTGPTITAAINAALGDEG